jgi:hypothetical protein
MIPYYNQILKFAYSLPEFLVEIPVWLRLCFQVNKIYVVYS